MSKIKKRIPCPNPYCDPEEGCCICEYTNYIYVFVENENDKINFNFDTEGGRNDI